TLAAEDFHGVPWFQAVISANSNFNVLIAVSAAHPGDLAPHSGYEVFSGSRPFAQPAGFISQVGDELSVALLQLLQLSGGHVLLGRRLQHVREGRVTGLLSLANAIAKRLHF